jgi:RNA polymerase sigma factor (sigma-70 family)
VAQDVFVAISRALPHYQPTALLRTWVFRIARNRCFKYREKFWNQIRILMGHGPVISAAVMPDPTPPREVVLETYADARLDQDRLDQLEPSLRRLPNGDRVLLLMYYWEELSFRAMARQLRLSEATVRRAVHAAEARLRALMTQEKKRNGAQRPAKGRRYLTGSAD